MNRAPRRYWLAAVLLSAGCASRAPAVASPPVAAAPAPAPAASPAQPAGAVLRVELEKRIAPVRRSVLSGFNFGNWMQVVDYGADLRAAKPAELRFPGGNIGDENDLSDHGLATFQANLSMLENPAAVIQTRVFQGSTSIQHDPPKNQPEDAADAVRWAKARGIRVAYWEIGNEPDLFAVTRGDPSWTAERYCQVFRAQAAAIKAVDPAARVAGPAVSGAIPARDRFLEAFVKECGDVVDILTWHIYPTDGTSDDAHAFSTVREADDTVAAYRALWADPGRNPKGSKRPIELAITEYGLSWFSSRMHHLIDMPAAMWAMEMAFRFDALGIASAHYFALQATGGHGLLDQGGVRRPTWYAFGVLNRLAGELVAVQAGDPDLWVHAARDGGRLDVVIVNRSTSPKPLGAVIPGFTLRYANFFDAAIADAEKPMARLPRGASVTLPPMAVVHLVYGQGEAAIADPYPVSP